MILTADQLITELDSLPDVRVLGPLIDSRYYCPHVDWLKEFGRFLVYSKPQYEAEKSDCDDFSLWAKEQATEALRKNGKIKNCGHTFAMCGLTIGMGLTEDGVATFFGLGGPCAHAANIVRCSNGLWYFFEPQKGEYDLVSKMLDNNAVSNCSIVWL
jgi:hypothetical protein